MKRGNVKIYQTFQYKQFQLKIHKRDNYTCYKCREQEHPLTITNPPKKLNEKWDSDSCQTVCLNCKESQ